MAGRRDDGSAEAINTSVQPAVASRRARMLPGYNETSSRPPEDWGGVPAVCDSSKEHRYLGAMLWRSQP